MLNPHIHDTDGRIDIFYRKSHDDLSDLYPSAPRDASDRGVANATLFSAPGIPGSPFLLGKSRRRGIVEFVRANSAGIHLRGGAAAVRHASRDGSPEDMECSCAILTLTPHKPE